MLAVQRTLSTGARPAFVSRTPMTIQAAHKKGAGSTKNGRDSNAQRRGVKVLGGQVVKAGGIIIRQVGSTWGAGDNVGTGKDYTLFSTVEGIVVYKKKKTEKSRVHVVPMESEEAQALIKKTHTIAPKEGVPSRKDRRKAMYTPRAQQRAAQQVSVATVVASVKP